MISALPSRDTDHDLRWYLGHMRPRVDAAVNALLREWLRSLHVGESHAIHAVLNGGKRLRGCLTCLTGAALGQHSGTTLQRAAAVECVQAASLAHDDFVDQDRIRRGARATWTVVGPRRAVLLGDVIFATALQEMVALSRADGLVLSRAIATVAQGAYSEPLESADLLACSTFDYNQLVRLKTGALFGAAAELGAVAANAPEDVCRAAFSFGAQVGDAYQVADDLADLTRLIEPADASGWDLQIAPVLAHYMPEELGRLQRMAMLGGCIPGHWLKGLWPCLRGRMQSDLVRRVESAGDVLAVFPHNYYTSMLYAVGGEMARTMYPQSAG